MFRKTRLWLHNRQLQKHLLGRRHQHKVMNMDTAKTVGILFDATEESIIPHIYGYAKKLQSMKKKVSVLGFIDANAVTENNAMPLFTRKQTNWLYVPKSPDALQFMEQAFDILVNVYAGNCTTLEYISALSAAKYRVGPYLSDKRDCFDLMINAGGPQPDAYLRQVNHYLEIIGNHEQTI